MKVQGTHYRSIWYEESEGAVRVIDQTRLPHDFVILSLRDVSAVCEALRHMKVRGAPLIGAAAAYGLALALRGDPSEESAERATTALLATRPTAVNLRWAVRRVWDEVRGEAPARRAEAAVRSAGKICDEDVESCRQIGEHGLGILRAVRASRPDSVLQVLTHCNAGWLATVDWGTALAPIYKAHQAGLPVHVWVDETRPRQQGASLTAWELGQEGIPHTVVPDTSGGHLLQRGRVDLCLVGSDRTTSSGDVCNKIGTYPMALAARDNQVPFYVAVPTSSIDWDLEDGVSGIPIEERDPREVTEIRGRTADGRWETVRVAPKETRALNYAFDVTPARLVTALITERGVAAASAPDLARLRARPAESGLGD